MQSFYKNLEGTQHNCKSIHKISPEHFTLSSDVGEPLFPDSVEAMRLVRGYMEAFGLNQDELYTFCTKNPAKVVGAELQ